MVKVNWFRLVIGSSLILFSTIYFFRGEPDSWVLGSNQEVVLTILACTSLVIMALSVEIRN